MTSSQRSALSFIVNFFGDGEVTRDGFTKFLYQKKETGLKPATLNAYIKLMKHVGKFLKTRDFDDYTYFKEVDDVIHDVLTKEEVDLMAHVRIRYNLYPDEINYRYKCFTYFLYETGCRLSEIQYLKWSDIHEDIVVFRSEITKGHKQREVPIRKGLFLLLDGLPRRGVYVFGGREGKPMAQQSLADSLAKRARAVGIKKRVNPHTFRHTFITTCVQNNMPLSIVASLVGHTSIQTTHKYYVHLHLEQMREALYNHHPSFKDHMTLDMIRKKVKNYIATLVDPTRFSVRTVEDNDTFTTSIKSHS